MKPELYSINVKATGEFCTIYGMTFEACERMLSKFSRPDLLEIKPWNEQAFTDWLYKEIKHDHKDRLLKVIEKYTKEQTK